jgi:hypothetical protein
MQVTLGTLRQDLVAFEEAHQLGCPRLSVPVFAALL